MVLVGDILNVVVFNLVLFNLVCMVGLVVGGFLIVVIGFGWVFIVNVVMFFVMLFVLMLM